MEKLDVNCTCHLTNSSSVGTCTAVLLFGCWWDFLDAALLSVPMIKKDDTPARYLEIQRYGDLQIMMLYRQNFKCKIMGRKKASKYPEILSSTDLSILQNQDDNSLQIEDI